MSMKSYKIVRIAALNYTYLLNSLKKKLPCTSYKAMQENIFSNAYVYGDSFARAMNAIGHSAVEIVYDFAPMQYVWAKENHISYKKKTWQKDILFAQIQKIRPDILYFQDVNALSVTDFSILKSLFPFVKKIVVFRGYPGLDTCAVQKIALADIVCVGSPLLVEKLSKCGISSHLVYHFFDPSILQKFSPAKADLEVTFVGSSGYGNGTSHLSRYSFLKGLLEKTPLTLWIDEDGCMQKSAWKAFIYNRIKRFLQKNPLCFSLAKKEIFPLKIQRIFQQIAEEKSLCSEKNISYPLIPLHKLYPHRCHLPLYGIPMYELFHRSKISFNIHSQAAMGYVDNIRMFHATGMGSCLLTDEGINLPDLFEKDYEVVTYKSQEECIEKIKYLIEHEGVRQDIAQRAQKKTLSCHTNKKRAEQIDALIQSS